MRHLQWHIEFVNKQLEHFIKIAKEDKQEGDEFGLDIEAIERASDALQEWAINLGILEC